MFFAHDAGDLEVAADMVLVEDGRDIEIDLGGAAQSRLGPCEPRAQLHEVVGGRSDVRAPTCFLSQREQRAPDPDDHTHLRRQQRRAVDVPAIARAIAAARVVAVPYNHPLGRVGLNPFAELCVLPPVARHHGDEASARALDVIHVLARAQFAVGNVEEVGAPGDGAQRIPGLDVGARVVDVAVGAAEGHGHMAVGGHGENEQQLLEIGAMGLGVSVGDGRRAAPSDSSPRGGTEAAAKADRGAVVVQLVEAQAEALSDCHDDLGQ